MEKSSSGTKLRVSASLIYCTQGSEWKKRFSFSMGSSKREVKQLVKSLPCFFLSSRRHSSSQASPFQQYCTSLERWLMYCSYIYYCYLAARCISHRSLSRLRKLWLNSSNLAAFGLWGAIWRGQKEDWFEDFSLRIEEGDKLLKGCFEHLRSICLGRLAIGLGLKSQ